MYRYKIARLGGLRRTEKYVSNANFLRLNIELENTFRIFVAGIELSFYSGVYSPSIGFTKQFGSISTQLIGLSGIFIGLGEVIGNYYFFVSK